MRPELKMAHIAAFKVKALRPAELLSTASYRAGEIDIRAPDSLDRVFHFLETPGTIVIADQGAGSGAETFSWFDRTAQIVGEFADVTSIGIVTKDPGSVESILTWAHHLGDRVRYLIVLNELLR